MKSVGLFLAQFNVISVKSKEAPLEKEAHKDILLVLRNNRENAMTHLQSQISRI